VNRDLADQLQKAGSQLQLWEAYHSAHAEATARLALQEAKFEQLANINMSGNNVAEVLPLALRDVKVGVKPFGQTEPKSAQQTGQWGTAMTLGQDRPQGQRSQDSDLCRLYRTWVGCYVWGWEDQVAAGSRGPDIISF
jgi:hypothetical protein